MARDVLERLRAADPAKRMLEPDAEDRERLRRAIVAIPHERRRRAWWRRRWGGRTLAVLLAGAVLLGCGTVYAERLITRHRETSYTLPGGTWQRLPLAVDGGEVRALTIDPRNTAVLYAATAEGLFKSNDGAATWNRLQAGCDVGYMTLDPQDPSHLLAFASRGLGTDQRLVESHDGGANWSTLPAPPHVLVLAGLWIDHSSTPATLYASCVGYVGGFFRSGDDGRTWSTIHAGIEGLGPSEMAIDSSAHTIYALYHSSAPTVLVRSSDGGITWSDVSAHLPGPMRTAWDAFRVDPADTSRLYIYAQERGVFASNDSGQTWSEPQDKARDWAMAVVSAPPGTPASAVQAASAFLVPFRRLSTAHRLTDAETDLPLRSVHPPVIVDSRDPSTLYLATAQGAYKSTDTGATWHRASEGIKNHNVFGVLVDRRSPSTLLALTPTGLVRSTDGGSTCATLLPTAVTSVAAAPSSPSTLYASTIGGVVKSTDGGETWSRPRHKGLPAEPGEVDVVLVAGDDPETVYAVAEGVVFRSTNGGRTWSRVRGLSTGGVQLLELPGDPSILFAAVYRGVIGSAPSHLGRLFRSDDRGRTWARIGDASWGAGPVTFAIDPWTPSKVFIKTEEGPVWHRSTDGGKSWHHFTLRGLAKPPAYLLFDPWLRDTVYTVSGLADPAVYRSQDGGTTWEDITAGLPDGWLGDRPELVVAPGGTLYTATEGGLYRWVPGGRRTETKADNGDWPVKGDEGHAVSSFRRTGSAAWRDAACRGRGGRADGMRVGGGDEPGFPGRLPHGEPDGSDAGGSSEHAGRGGRRLLHSPRRVPGRGSHRALRG